MKQNDVTVSCCECKKLAVGVQIVRRASGDEAFPWTYIGAESRCAEHRSDEAARLKRNRIGRTPEM